MLHYARYYAVRRSADFRHLGVLVRYCIVELVVVLNPVVPTVEVAVIAAVLAASSPLAQASDALVVRLG